jgi:simple sugar transport system ATP-binding protein
MGHIPEDRSVRGVIRDYSVSENLILGYQKTSRFSGKVQLKLKDIAQFAKETVKKFDIRCSGIEEPLSALSGGNQQKVVIGRVMSENPQIVIAAQPTRGVDIGAVEYIHECLIELRDSGKAILLISADLDEVLKLSDRIQVLYDGRIVSNDATENYNERRLGALMTGQEDETRDVG